MDDVRNAAHHPHPLPRAAADLDLTPDARQALTEACTRFALGHVATLSQQPSWDLDGARELAATFRTGPPAQGRPIATILERFGAAVAKSFNAAGPGYLAYIPGGGLYPAALADYLALAVNRFVGVWNPAPVLVEIECAAIDWLRELVGFPAGSRGLLTSGGSMSTLIALVTARRNLLGDDFQSAVLYMSDQTHHCVHKAALLAGFPARHCRELPADSRGRLEPAALDAAIRADRARGLRPFLAVANAGTTNTGAIDPLPEIADVCAAHGLWLHADAAYGGFFRLVPGGETLLPGFERADSLILDPHKGLFLPYGTGCLLVRDPDALERAHTLGAGYLQDLELPAGAINFADHSPELSRDFRGLRVWLPLMLYGVEAIRDNLREKLELARWAYEELQATPGFECFDAPQLSIVAFRYRPARGDADAFNAALLQRVNARRRVFLSSTRLEGKYVLRICVLSFRTHGREVAMAVEDLRAAAQELEAE
jgi:aromatic-L-amino-acid/L-tryptophan decarboxylase